MREMPNECERDTSFYEYIDFSLNAGDGEIPHVTVALAYANPLDFSVQKALPRLHCTLTYRLSRN